MTMTLIGCNYFVPDWHLILTEPRGENKLVPKKHFGIYRADVFSIFTAKASRLKFNNEDLVLLVMNGFLR